MSTFESAGHHLLQLHAGHRSLASSIARALSAAFSAPVVLPSDRTLTGATFIEQEPGLVKETHEFIKSF